MCLNVNVFTHESLSLVLAWHIAHLFGSIQTFLTHITWLYSNTHLFWHVRVRFSVKIRHVLNICTHIHLHSLYFGVVFWLPHSIMAIFCRKIYFWQNIYMHKHGSHFIVESKYNISWFWQYTIYIKIGIIYDMFSYHVSVW